MSQSCKSSSRLLSGPILDWFDVTHLGQEKMKMEMEMKVNIFTWAYQDEVDYSVRAQALDSPSGLRKKSGTGYIKFRSVVKAFLS